MTAEKLPVRSHADSNRQLVERFDVYLQARGRSENTRRKYGEALAQLVSFLGSQDIIDVERATIRRLMALWTRKGLHPNSARLYLIAFRSFYRFLRLAGLSHHDPTFILSQPKVPSRIPIVLTIEQIEKLINAARYPFERAAVEVLYSTGCRVSEFVNLRLEDIMWSGNNQPSTIRVHKGKGGKDRVVPIGKYAEAAIREYQKWRPSRMGYLFEAPPRTGVIFRHPSTRPGKKGYWHARFYVDRVQRTVSLGSIEDIPTEAKAFDHLKRFLKSKPGYQPVPTRPYDPAAIRLLLKRLADRAGFGHVHPHALRRSMASHMLKSGADLRALQDMLGHERVTTTARYTILDVEDLRRAYEKAHPHARGEDDGKE